MKCKILHESNGRMRLHAEQTRMTLRQADILEAYLRQVPGVTEVKIYDRTCDAVVLYRGARTDLIRALAAFSYAASEALAPEHSSRALGREYEDKLVLAVCRHYFKKLFLPMPLRTVITLFRSVHYLRGTLVPAAREDSGARARRNRHRRLHAARRLRDGGQHHVPARHRRYPR